MKYNIDIHRLPTDLKALSPQYVVSEALIYRVVLSREEADAFLTVVRRGNFDFGILVGVLEQKIAKVAYDAADDSGGDIIVTLYTRMCQDIKRLIADIYDNIAS
ncbi:10071_t:CDS:2 [Dentiscutata erythropus]|uniref:10071_t:CDS:1 n=1 Tax=Dentiscutata erythropus TaxID=1348616 RepID=A0A9N9CZI8_9GLOM|nr:10071_t:CDS:2 [Dentiscutata erythropus]